MTTESTDIRAEEIKSSADQLVESGGTLLGIMDLLCIQIPDTVRYTDRGDDYIMISVFSTVAKIKSLRFLAIGSEGIWLLDINF